MNLPPVVLDFETEAIHDRPNYPPIPVGLAVLDPVGEWAPAAGIYLTDMAAACRYLRDLYLSGRHLLFHNAKFDTEVALVHFGLPLPEWWRIHDTLYELFLVDPHAITLQLKPASEHWLGLPPDERNAVNDWLYRHGIIKSPTAKDAGAYISRAPRGLTGGYAVGDVIRTWGLHEKLFPYIVEAGMEEAYDRERKLMPILLENERTGMRVDTERLREHITIYKDARAEVDKWIFDRLGYTFNIDSDTDTAEVIRRTGMVQNFVKTKTGRDSVAKKNLTRDMFSDPEVHDAFGYRNRVTTALSMSMEPWLEMADRNDGYIYTSWNQVRQARGTSGAKGTRTGRLSCSRFQNVTKDWYDKGDYVYPAQFDVPDLPLVRSYILGDDGELFCHRDYNQQEFRILAHFEGAALAEMYRTNPKMNMHTWMHDEIVRMTGNDFGHRMIKILNFMELYGGGTSRMAGAMGTNSRMVEKIRAAKRKLVPGIGKLMRDLQNIGKKGLPIRTWGGRLYYSEPPKFIGNMLRSFDYKLLNYRVQGSAADCTKEAVIRYHDAKKHGRFLVTVHDEINFSCHPDYAYEELQILKEVMASVEFSVPMLSDAKWGWTWGDLEKVVET